MKKIFVILLTVFLFVSCSSIRKNEINLDKQYALEEMMKKIKIQLENNNFDEIELYFDDNFINRKILSELKKIDFSQMKIVYGKPEFYKDNAKNIVAVIYADNVEYFQFSYKLKNQKWSIMEIKNGR